YQVELDLLYEQLQANECEINEELTHYRSLYEQAPAAFLILANDGEIIEGNLAAGKLLGKPAMELAGMALSAFLAPGQKSPMNALLRNAAGHASDTEAAKGSLELTSHKPLSVNARAATTGDSILMILTDAKTPSATT
ncbi:MAG: PAS domain-containing protein, partial [Marinobacter sp.]